MQSLVIVAHGSHLNPGSSAPTYDHADTIRATGAFDEGETGFWKRSRTSEKCSAPSRATDLRRRPAVHLGGLLHRAGDSPRTPPRRLGRFRVELRRPLRRSGHPHRRRHRPGGPLLRSSGDPPRDDRRDRPARGRSPPTTDVGEGSGSPSSATVPSATRTRRKRSSTTPTGSPSATASTR